jgi:predicted nucleotidyltransferase
LSVILVYMTTIEQLKEELRSVCKRHGVAVAYLFGSVVRDNSGPLSDVDVAVLFQNSEPDTRARIKRENTLSSELEGAVKRDVDLVDLEEVTSPLLRNRAIRRGELLYCMDHKRRQELELRALHDYEDTRYLREVQNRAMEKRIKEGTFGKPL